MGAVLSVPVPVCGERFSAGRTGIIIHGLPLDQVEVAVPPPVAARVRTEILLLSTGILDHLFPTAPAGLLVDSTGIIRHRFLHASCHAVPSAERLDCTLAYAGKLADLFVPVPVFTIFGNGGFLFIRHVLYLRILGKAACYRYLLCLPVS